MVNIRKVLLVEDDRSLRAVLNKKLSESGFDVTEAQNGVEAIETFKLSPYDIVLLDIVMPEKSGIEVLETIRYELESKVPVVVLTNLNHQLDIETGRNLGVNEYLIKSNVSLRTIVQTTHSVLDTVVA